MNLTSTFAAIPGLEVDDEERKGAFNAYIREVQKGSQADVLGVEVNDEIIGVGDFSLAGQPHDETMRILATIPALSACA